jgi:hypothetical protein
MCNTSFYSFRFPLSNFFGIFRFELMVRNFQDQNYGVSSWEKWTFLIPSSLRVQSRLQAAESSRNIRAVYGEDSIAEGTAQKWFVCFKQGNFGMSDTPRSGWDLVGYGGVYLLWTAWEEPNRHFWTLKSTTSPSGGSNPAKTPGSTTWSDSSARRRPTTHCKLDESGHSGTRLGLEILPHPPYCPDLAPFHRITTSSAISPTICAEFPSTMTLSSKIGSTILHDQTGGFLQAWVRKPARTLGGSHE